MPFMPTLPDGWIRGWFGFLALTVREPADDISCLWETCWRRISHYHVENNFFPCPIFENKMQVSFDSQLRRSEHAARIRKSTTTLQAAKHQSENILPPISLPTIIFLKPSLFDKRVEYSLLRQQLLGSAKLRHGSLVEHHNAVRVEDRVDAVRDRDDGALRKERAAQCLLQHGVGLNVHRRRSLVQHENVGGCEHCACEGDELALA